MDINEIKLEINDKLKYHLNQIELNKEIKQSIDTQIKDISMKLFHFICSQQVKLIRQTGYIAQKLESNLNILIKKENDLLKNINNKNNIYEKIINDYNEVKSLENKKQICFDYEFKKNEMIESYLIIGHLLVFIFFRQRLKSFYLETFDTFKKLDYLAKIKISKVSRYRYKTITRHQKFLGNKY
jgi:hypothetical protein